jgi:hypothetical protein
MFAAIVGYCSRITLKFVSRKGAKKSVPSLPFLCDFASLRENKKLRTRTSFVNTS